MRISVQFSHVSQSSKFHALLFCDSSYIIYTSLKLRRIGRLAGRICMCVYIRVYYLSSKTCSFTMHNRNITYVETNLKFLLLLLLSSRDDFTFYQLFFFYIVLVSIILLNNFQKHRKSKLISLFSIKSNTLDYPCSADCNV